MWRGISGGKIKGGIDMAGKLENKVAWVSGANKGIGEGIALYGLLIAILIWMKC